MRNPIVFSLLTTHSGCAAVRFCHPDPNRPHVLKCLMVPVEALLTPESCACTMLVWMRVAALHEVLYKVRCVVTPKGLT